jgi:hypothetical protein
MEIPLTDIIDRLSILKLKMERIGEKEFRDEFDAYQVALTEFENKGVRIRREWLVLLYEINKETWDLTIALREASEKENGLEEMGRLHIQRLILNKKRVAIKNEIADETGSGSRDIEMN